MPGVTTTTTSTTPAPSTSGPSTSGPKGSNHRKRQSQKTGLSPGSLVHIGERRMDAPRMTVIEYDDKVFSTRELAAVKDAPDHCRAYDERETVVWINVDGIHEAAFVDELGKRFGLHPLVLEDVMNAGQRPKLEEYDDCLFCVLKMLDVDEDTGHLMVEQISIVIGKGFVLTFQERDGDVFEGVRDRIKNHKGKIRKMGADYLAYALIDAIVDHYFVALETMTELVEDLEHRMQEHLDRIDVKEIYTLKREILFLRKTIFPAREVMGELARHEESDLISSAVDVYFRDVHDHVLQVSESLDTTREMVVSMLEQYHSSQGTRMNEVMRVLTVISTIFMPLTFIVGIYGMNFDNMPELRKEYGYFACIGVMALVALGQIIYMKRNRWL